MISRYEVTVCGVQTLWFALHGEPLVDFVVGAKMGTFYFRLARARGNLTQ